MPFSTPNLGPVVSALMGRKRQNFMDDRGILRTIDPEQAVPLTMDHYLFMQPTWERYMEGMKPNRRMPDMRKPGRDA